MLCSRSFRSGASIAFSISAESRSTTAWGVFAGADTPHQVVMSKPFRPDSSSVGRPGRKLERARVDPGAQDQRRAGAHDVELLARYVLDGRPEVARVLEPDVGQHGNGGVKDVGGVVAPAEAGLEEWADLLEGDAHTTLPGIDDVFDLVFLDAEKDDYEQLFQLARAKVEPAAVFVADNVLSHEELQPYSAARQADPTLESVTVPLDRGLEVTVVLR